MSDKSTNYVTETAIISKFKFIIMLLFIICLSAPKCFAVKVNDYGAYFGSEGFIGYIDYNFFSNLSTCTPYTTPVVVNAPLGIPNGSYKTQIVGLQANKCVVRDLSKASSWELLHEYQIPMAQAKNLSTLLMNEIKNPALRLKHLKEFCTSEQNKREEACNYLRMGRDKDNYFLHIDLGLDKYETYPKSISIPKSGKTMYMEKF